MLFRKKPLDGSIEAEYYDGFVFSEAKHDDVSPYDPTVNILRSILEKHPEAEHGRMVRFSMFYKDKWHDIDWTALPVNARPIRYKNLEQDSIGGQIIETRLMTVDFGYQYTDENGKNQQVVTEL